MSCYCWMSRYETTPWMSRYETTPERDGRRVETTYTNSGAPLLKARYGIDGTLELDGVDGVLLGPDVQRWLSETIQRVALRKISGR